MFENSLYLAYDVDQQNESGRDLVLSKDGLEIARFSDQDTVKHLVEFLRQILSVSEITTLIIQTGEEAPGIVEGIYLALRSGVLAIRNMYNLRLERENPNEVRSRTALEERHLLERFMILSKAVARSEGSGAVALELSYLFGLPEETQLETS